MKQMDLIQEAIKRGYKAGTIIHYEPEFVKDHDTLGDGEFKIDEDGRLIKYECKKEDRVRTGNNRFDVIHDDDGWVKIISK